MCLGKSNSKKYNFSGISRAFCLKEFRELYKPRNKTMSCFSDRLCPDAYCDKKIDKTMIGKYKFRRLPVDYNSVDKGKHYILLLLESPHRDEFKYKNNPRPAMGETGNNIRDYFLNDLLNNNVKKHMDNEQYTVVLINPIQFQTSLGNKSYYRSGIKDYNWVRMWNSRCNDFLKRINCYIFSKKDRNSVIVFNLCTDSTNKQSIVSKVLRNEFPKLLLFEAQHPSSWNKIKKIKVVKKR